MTFMKNAGRRLGLTTIAFFLSTTAFAQPAVAAAPTHDPWVLGTSALTALGSAILTLGGGALLARGKDRASARYLATRLAVLLEDYAITCAESLSGHELHLSSGGNAGEMIGAIPEMPEYPIEEGWSALRPALLERALTLRSQVKIGRGSVASLAQVADDYGDIADHGAGHVGVCGHMALSIARDMRRDYRLVPFDPTRTWWDIAPILRRHHDRIVGWTGQARARSYTFPISSC